MSASPFRGRLTAAAAAAAMMLVAACSGSGSADQTQSGTTTDDPAPGTSTPAGTDQAGSGDPIVIGHTGGLTGFMAVFDIPVQQGMQLAIDDINEAGGVLGRELVLVTSDNASDVTKIQSAAEEVLQQGAAVVVTSCDYDMGAPAARTANDAGVIAFSCAGSPNFGFAGVGPLAYNISPGSKSEGALLAEYAFAQGYTSPFVLEDSTLEYTQVIADVFEERWIELGGTLAGRDVFANSDATVESQVGAIRSSGADVVMASTYPPGGAKALAEIRTQGIDAPILAPGAFDGIYWLDAVPGLSGLTITGEGSLWGDDPSAERNDFFVRFAEELGAPASNGKYPLSGYSSVQAFAVAAEKAGSIDTAAVQAALDSFSGEELLIGPTTYAPDCHLPSGREYLLITYTDGVPAVAEARAVESIPGGNPC